MVAKLHFLEDLVEYLQWQNPNTHVNCVSLKVFAVRWLASEVYSGFDFPTLLGFLSMRDLRSNGLAPFWLWSMDLEHFCFNLRRSVVLEVFKDKIHAVE